MRLVALVALLYLTSAGGAAVSPCYPRRACGNPGISRRDCEVKGCCYDDSIQASGPRCFSKGTQWEKCDTLKLLTPCDAAEMMSEAGVERVSCTGAECMAVSESLAGNVYTLQGEEAMGSLPPEVAEQMSVEHDEAITVFDSTEGVASLPPVEPPSTSPSVEAEGSLGPKEAAAPAPATTVESKHGEGLKSGKPRSECSEPAKPEPQITATATAMQPCEMNLEKLGWLILQNEDKAIQLFALKDN